ncbi:MAG: hypothetical protein P9L94_17365 [Candidatus Hinthialibacter antarcticus]|nr:hypothetical protein [Candidatus Hinthialibacter antarcticus]
MKSAAFNLAFKVHRNELSFPEALLRSVESQAAEDFIEALNSLAGDTKYNASDLQELIQQAESQVGGSSSGRNKQIEKLEEQLKALQKKFREQEEAVQSYKGHISALKVTTVPGLNAFLVFLVGFMMGFIPFLLGFYIFAGVVLLISIVLITVLTIQDLDKLKKEKEAIHKKEMSLKQDIDRCLTAMEGLGQQIEEKENQLNRLKPQSGAGESASDDSPGESESAPPDELTPLL